jgi:glycosyltransferase involved in cell wall biosynthesis
VRAKLLTAQTRATLPFPAEPRQPVRVCFLIDALSRAGTETQLVTLIQRLDRRRIRPYLCLLRGENIHSRALEPEGCPVLRLNVQSLCGPSALGQAFRLACFLRRHRIDVLQMYFPDSTYFGALVGRLAGVPCVVRAQHNLGYCLTPLHRRLGRLCNRIVDFTVANCAACRDAALANEGAPRKSIVVLENGVDVASFARIPTIRAFQDPPRVGVIANLRPVKELDLFVRAAAAVSRTRPNVRFLIGGTGQLRQELERLAGELRLGERFRLPGRIDDVAAFLAGLDVCVLCSGSEGMSNAVLEYMAAGRPIVATAVGATPQLIADGVHGLLVPPGDEAALARAIGRLLDDPALAVRLAAAARRRVRDEYSLERMVERFEDFYESCLSPLRRSGERRGVSPPVPDRRADAVPLATG